MIISDIDLNIKMSVSVSPIGLIELSLLMSLILLSYFEEPMLLFPVLRKMPFSLQDLARTVICDSTTYNGVSKLPIPKTLQNYLREYHYRHKVESRPLEINNGSSAVLPAVMNCTTNVRCLERRDREQ